MKSTRKKQKLIVSALVGTIMIPGSVLTAEAADGQKDGTSALPIAGIETVLEECYETNVKENINLYMVPTKEGEYLNRAFSNVGEDDFAYIRSAPDESSDWIGKIYSDSTVTVLEYVGDWTKIHSGSVEGYVHSNVLYTGDEARRRAQEYEKEEATVEAYVLNVRAGQGTWNEILTQIEIDEKYEVTGEAVENWYPVKVGEIDGWVSGDYVNVETTWAYAESREEEEQRAAREEAERLAAEALPLIYQKGYDRTVAICRRMYRRLWFFRAVNLPQDRLLSILHVSLSVIPMYGEELV